jgi:iron complex transport system permease protein
VNGKPRAPDHARPAPTYRINAGAAFGAVLVIVAFEEHTMTVAGGALVGGLATAVAIYVLAYRRGVTGYRMVLIEVGATAVFSSLTSYLLTRADIYDAARAVTWLSCSLNGRGWTTSARSRSRCSC